MSTTADQIIIELEAKLERYRREVDDARRDFEDNMDRIERAGRRGEGATNRLGAGVGTLKSGIAALGGVIAAAGLLELGKSLLNAAGEFQKLNVQLEVATGSAAGAKTAFAAIQELAAKTPFSVQEVTKAFIDLKNRGLDPSAAAITSYANTAGALGKKLDDVIQAVGDAAGGGGFERLNEAFGVKGLQAAGGKVSLTFKGVTTIVGNSAAEIEKYLLNIGNTDFASGVAKQSATLEGSLSNLGDNLSRLAVQFGEGGFAAAVQTAVQSMSSGTSGADELARQLGGLAGDAITAAAEIVASFSGVNTSAVDTVRNMRASFEGLRGTLADVFSPMVDAARAAFDAIGLSSILAADKIKLTFQAIDFLTEWTGGKALSRAFGGKPVDLAKDYESRTFARRARIDDEAARRTMAKVLATPLGKGGDGDYSVSPSDPLAAFRARLAAADKKAAADRKKTARAKAVKVDRNAASAAAVRAGTATYDIGDASFDRQSAGERLDDSIAAPIREAEQSARLFRDVLGEIGEITPIIPDDIRRMGEQLQVAEDIGARFVQDLSTGLVEALAHGESLGDVLVNAFERAALAIASSKLESLLNGVGGAGTGGLGGIFTSLFGGPRAGGGRVSPSRVYEVGEKGRELFVPDSAGRILPNGSYGNAPVTTSGGGGSVTHVYQSFDVRGAVVTEKLYADMQAIGDNAAVRGAMGGAALADTNATRRARRQL